MTIQLKVAALVGQLILAARAQTQCADPIGGPQSTAGDRSWFSFFAKIDFLPYYFTETQGFCRKGNAWDGEPALKTNAGEVHSRANNAPGALWFCLEEDRTKVGCMAECETRGNCGAFDRPPVDGFAECCIFQGNHTGDGAADRNCYEKHIQRPLLPGDIVDASVSVLPIPFLGYLTLSSESVGVVATAEMGICPFWTWCGFVVKDCQGQVLYKVTVESLPDIDTDGTLFPGTVGSSYSFHAADGTYLGRSSHLSDGAEPIRILNAENVQVSMLITAAGFFRRTFFPLRWFVNTAITREPASQVPLADPRLLMLMVTYQFRNLGYIGPFWLLLFIVVVVAVYCYLRRKTHVGRAAGIFRSLPYFTTTADEEEEFLPTDGGCCTGRGKPAKKDTWASSLTIVSPDTL